MNPKLAEMSSEKYYKTLTELTIPELCCYGLKLGLPRSNVGYVKNDIIKKIIAEEGNFLDDPDRKFYFTRTKANRDGKDTDQLKYVASPGDTGSFTKKPLQDRFKIDIEATKEEIEKEKAEALKRESEEVESLDLSQFVIKDEQGAMIKTNVISENKASHTDAQITTGPIAERILRQIQQECNTSQSNPLRATNIGYRQKLKYEPTHGIEAFIRSVESYCQANDITDQKKLVAIAKSALNNSDDGLLLQDSLLPAEEEDWTLFKSKLVSILGNPPDFYRDSYRSFRRGNLRLGIAMSTLIQAYKRGFKENGDSLTESDQQHIMHQFINSLDNPLRGLLKAEEKKLTFSTIAERANELERCFGSGFRPDSAATLMFPESRVSMVQSQNALENGNTIQLKMIELMNSMITESKKQHEETMKRFRGQTRRNQTGRPNSKIADVAQKLQGHCYFHVKFNNCRRTDCRYKHESEIPKEIKDLCK